MSIWIQISPGSPEPIYSQIVTQLSRAIAQSHLTIGDKLPAVRNLATEIVVNPNTVAKAYTILEQQGLVTTKTGSGTYVADPQLRDKDIAQFNILNERIDNIITQALNLGRTADMIIELTRTRLARFDTKSSGGNNLNG